MSVTEMRHASGDCNNDNSRSAEHSTGSEGFALLSADGWLDVAPYLDYYNNAILRFASKALNGLIRRHLPTLPLRVIADLLAEPRGRYYYEGQTWCLDHPTVLHKSPESMLREVLSMCKGFVIARLRLKDLPYNEQVMDVMVQNLPFVCISQVSFDGIVSGHDQVHRLLEVMPGLREVVFKNDPAHPNATAVLNACAKRRVPYVSLNLAADVTEAEILDFWFNDNSAGITRKFGIAHLWRSLSDSFFESIVKRCRRNQCKSISFAIGAILTDPTDGKYGRYMVERNDSAAMYKFEKVGQTDLPFTIVVGINKSKRFYLKVLQGDTNDLCSSVEVARKIPSSKKMSR